MGFTNFKIEGRGLGSALILEFLLYYLTKPEYQLVVREKIYLDNMLDLFKCNHNAGRDIIILLGMQRKIECQKVYTVRTVA